MKKNINELTNEIRYIPVRFFEHCPFCSSQISSIRISWNVNISIENIKSNTNVSFATGCLYSWLKIIIPILEIKSMTIQIKIVWYTFFLHCLKLELSPQIELITYLGWTVIIPSVIMTRTKKVENSITMTVGISIVIRNLINKI